MKSPKLKYASEPGRGMFSKEEGMSVDIEDTSIPSRHKKPPPHPKLSGKVDCLRCGRPFESWDRTRNRICPWCSARK